MLPLARWGKAVGLFTFRLSPYYPRITHWPLVRRLARALVERKEISGRRCRQILFRALRKDLRRSRAVAEKDRRHQQAWGAELRQALGRVK